MTTDDYVRAVGEQLKGVPSGVRAAALDDLRDLLAEGIAPSDLGPAEAYADELRRMLSDDPDPASAQADVLGMPLEGRGITDPGVRGRIWAPQDERLVVPRLLGGGWTINLGAVAVKLGLLRPDDWDDQSHERIPARLIKAWRGLPWFAAAVAVVTAGRVVRSGGEIPVHWGLDGEPNDWADARWAALPGGLAVAAAVWGAIPAAGDDTFVRPALAGYATTLAASTTLLMAGGSKRGRFAALAGYGLSVSVLAAMIAIPVTVAVRESWELSHDR